MKSNNKIGVLIAAGGKGTRAKLPYPKTLFKINGKEILLNILDITCAYDQSPTIIVSPTGEIDINTFLLEHSKTCNLVIQEKAKGMGDAVLHFKKSPSFELSEDILLIWGDIPFIEENTIKKMVERHFEKDNTFTFVTAKTNAAYTRVNRDQNNKIIEVLETREENLPVKKGERDIGLFIFKKKEIFDLLELNLSKKYSSKTKEHGFLYLVSHLVKNGYKVEGLEIAKSKELISLNKISDLDILNK